MEIVENLAQWQADYEQGWLAHFKATGHLDWARYVRPNNKTTVMAFETGFVRDYSVGAAYAEYFASPDTMFPVWQRSNLLPTKSWVFTQLINGQPKVYPLSVLEKELVINDTLAGQNLVVIYDEGGLGARAYERADWRFTPTTTGVILDESGVEWQVTEAALVGPDGTQLARLPGHMAYWFGWFSFYPQTAVYGVAE
jgi:hypothetical protein